MSPVAFVVAVCVAAGVPGSDDYLKGCDALRVAHYGDAVKSFEACAALDGPLTPYAKLRSAFCVAAAGDPDAGVKAYHSLMEQYPKGPWVRMAKTYLASLLALYKDYEKASSLYTDALSFEPKPWWVDRYDAAAAAAFVQTPDAASRGWTYYRNVIANSRLITPRVEAATHLLESSDAGNKLAASWGMTKSGECKQGLDILLALAPELLTDAQKDFDWKAYATALSAKAGAKAGDLEPLRELARAQSRNPWMREWLAYLARVHTASGRIDVAKEASGLLLESFGDSDEAALALWWLAARLAKDDKSAEAIDAYQRFARKYPDNSRADDALFAVAEQQRSLKSVNGLVEATEKLAARFPKSSLLPKAWYWVGCAELKADKKKAAEAFRHAAKYGPGDFYAHRALLRLQGGAKAGSDIRVGGASAFLKAFPLPSEPPGGTPQELLSEAWYQRLLFFATNGLEEAEWETLDLAPQLKGGEKAAGLYTALAEAGVAFTAENHADAFQWGNENGSPSVARQRLDFPRAYWPIVVKIGKEMGVDPYLILAVARQESTFRPALASSAGAVGVMQLMPGTAEHMVKTDPEISPETGANLESPVNSLRLGARYLKLMLDRSDGNIAFALASYNAGPGNCAKWRKQYAKADLETFVESIPFSETRDYVKIVLGNYAAYYSLYPPAGATER